MSCGDLIIFNGTKAENSKAKPKYKKTKFAVTNRKIEKKQKHDGKACEATLISILKMIRY